jgi:hypothetical protein
MKLTARGSKPEGGAVRHQSMLQVPAVHAVAVAALAFAGDVEDAALLAFLAVPVEAVGDPQGHIQGEERLPLAWLAVDERQPALGHEAIDQPCRRRQRIDTGEVQRVVNVGGVLRGAAMCSAIDLGAGASSQPRLALGTPIRSHRYSAASLAFGACPCSMISRSASACPARVQARRRKIGLRAERMEEIRQLEPNTVRPGLTGHAIVPAGRRMTRERHTSGAW